ncbi:MAG: hypothetical protein MZW92_48050 [Comamonadaceae bacterium]|nr:hypothetical protein [Comamonadaceae bacterium]
MLRARRRSDRESSDDEVAAAMRLLFSRHPQRRRGRGRGLAGRQRCSSARRLARPQGRRARCAAATSTRDVFARVLEGGSHQNPARQGSAR